MFQHYLLHTNNKQRTCRSSPVLVLLPSMELKLVCTLLCSLLVSAALHLPQHASGRISGCNLGKKAEVVHAAAKGSTVEVSSVGTEHKYEDEGGLIFYNADYSLATTHAPPLPKHHP